MTFIQSITTICDWAPMLNLEIIQNNAKEKMPEEKAKQNTNDL